MDPQLAIDIARQSSHIILLLAAPVLVATFAVGVAVGVLQAMTQIHDPTVMFVVKLAVAVAVISVSLPWMMEHYASFSRELIEQIPQTMFPGTPP
jgi:flagellar biosynthetic protein FliQ